MHSSDVLMGFAHEYMYLSCIQFIVEVKTGAPFAEHSPMLNDISNLRNWAAVNVGLKRMYRGEVRLLRASP